MAEKERQMNKKVNALSAKLRTEEEEVCILHWENTGYYTGRILDSTLGEYEVVNHSSWCSAQTCSSDIR